MDCCQCQGIEQVFDERQAKKDLKQYRKKGPSSTTRILVEAIKAQGVQDLSLLDIGGGVGAIQHGLLGPSHLPPGQLRRDGARHRAGRRRYP